jgi:hypothetical protein
VRLPPGFVGNYEQSSEEATVRVLLNCTGKFVGSETAKVIWGNLLKSTHSARFFPASQINHQSQALQKTVT